MTQKIYILAIGIILISCNTNQPPPPEKSIPHVIENQVILDSARYILDTTLASGNKISMFYNMFEDRLTAKISTTNWDTSFFVNEELLKDNSSINPLNETMILWSTKQFAGVRNGCGVPCYYEVVFPFISGERPRRYFFPYTNNDSGIYIEENLIAFISDYRTPEGYPTIKIKNLLTRKTDSISVLSNWEPRISMNEFIDTLYATNHFIFIGQYDRSGYLKYQDSKKIGLN